MMCAAPSHLLKCLLRPPSPICSLALCRCHCAQVAERHPYSVYRKAEMPAFAKQRSKDPFTTAFGEGLPVRTFDRNYRQRTLEQSERMMEKPFPTGYTGHVRAVRHVNGQTYGRQVREQINGVARDLTNPSIGSSHREHFQDPNKVVSEGCDRAARARVRSASTQKPDETMYVSSSQLAYTAPGPQCYYTPAWSERSTSNIGQPDVYGHAHEKPLHMRQPSKRAMSASAAGASIRSTVPAAGAAPGRRPNSVVPPRSIAGAAGAATRSDRWLFEAVRR